MARGGASANRQAVLWGSIIWVAGCEYTGPPPVGVLWHEPESIHAHDSQLGQQPHRTPLASCAQLLRGAGYKLRQRALHVFTEAARVPEFREACNSRASTQDKMAELARLMNDSQTSCRRAAPGAGLYNGMNSKDEEDCVSNSCSSDLLAPRWVAAFCARAWVLQRS